MKTLKYARLYKCRVSELSPSIIALSVTSFKHVYSVVSRPTILIRLYLNDRRWLGRYVVDVDRNGYFVDNIELGIPDFTFKQTHYCLRLER